MKKSLFSLILLLIILTSFASATITRINYPSDKEVISHTARIQLNISSSLSEECYFTYNNIAKNQSINCNGISLVNLPNADGRYNITVADNASSSITQEIIVIRPYGSLVTATYIFTIFLILLSFYWLAYTITKFAELSFSLKDFILSFGMLFAFLLDYQLVLEYVNVPFIINWLDLTLSACWWVLLPFSGIAFIVCAIVRAINKKKPIKD